MGTVWMSSTLAPAEGRPEIIARLIMRGLRCGSRLTVTVGPWAAPRRRPPPRVRRTPGVMSTLTRPEMPYAPNSERCARPPQIRLSFRLAPVSSSLLGQIRTSLWTIAPSPMTVLSPTTAPSSTTGPAAHIALLADDRATELDTFAHVGVVPHHAALDPGVAIDDGVVADGRGADDCAPLRTRAS